MLNFLLSDPVSFLVWIAALLSAITVHEFAHAWMAVRLGDPTPKLQGRLTLNPIAHLDPIGTLMLILVRFGWGKPVQFDPFNLENPRRDSALISLAGPISNILLATIFSLLLRLSVTFGTGIPLIATLAPPFIMLNVILAVFNLIPVHPLDGGKILVGILPPREAAQADRFMKQYGIFIVLLMVFPIFGSSPVFTILNPIINLLMSIYIPGLGAV